MSVLLVLISLLANVDLIVKCDSLTVPRVQFILISMNVKHVLTLLTKHIIPDGTHCHKVITDDYLLLLSTMFVQVFAGTIFVYIYTSLVLHSWGTKPMTFNTQTRCSTPHTELSSQNKIM